MKEQWKNEKDVAILEEGLQQKKQEYISKSKYNTNCCKQWTRYIRLIFLLTLTLFLGWGCYMILQNYHSRVTENEIADVTREKYSLVSEVQKSHPTGEISVIFVKPEITDKLNNNFLEAIGLKEPDLMPSKTIGINVDSSMQTSTQNSVSMPSNNIMEASDINNPLMTSSSKNKGLLKMMVWKNFPIQNIDKMIIFNNNKESNVLKQFLEKLHNIAINDLKRFANNNDFTETVDRLMLNNQEDRAPNAFNEIKSAGFNVRILKVEDFEDLTKSLKNSAQDLKQIFLDISEQFAIQDNHSEKSSSNDGTDEQINASTQSDFVIYPPNKSPPIFANNLQSGPKDISESNKIKRKRRNPPLESTTENTETIDAFTPETKIHNQSHESENIDSDIFNKAPKNNKVSRTISKENEDNDREIISYNMKDFENVDITFKEFPDSRKISLPDKEEVKIPEEDIQKYDMYVDYDKMKRPKIL
ncbi:uncharacterized protein LOC114932238 [Nylanderia fulva]|uniref:uncharacterized protein LOC114932238 n=1 Tax=Nylanderia fulva TaxID=613905 RepID=UPI0010FB5906|nr:uncharacterized protein LOC114932238 [Nylanderia fulva]